MIRKIKHIVIHCTATVQEAKVTSIQNYWRNNLKWKSPGYHIIIEADGTRHYLQPFDLPTNGVRGHNASSIHICYIGGIDKDRLPVDNRTDKQKASLLTSIQEAMLYALQSDSKPSILGHKDFKGVKKACPCFDVKYEYAWIIE